MTPRLNQPGALLDARPFERVERDGHTIESAFLVFNDHLGRRVELFASRCLPAAGDGPFPAVLHAPGGGQTIDARDLVYLARQGFAAASFDWQIQGAIQRDPERRTRFPEPVVAQHVFVPSPEALVFPVAILGAGVVIDWLASARGYDTTRVGMTGISWGGYLTWLINAHEPRVRAAVPVYGAGVFTPRHPYPISGSPEALELWRTRYDPQALGDPQRAPVCFLSGTNDFFGANADADKLLNALAVESRRAVVPNGGHYLTARESQTGVAWLRHHLMGGPSLPEQPRLSRTLKIDADGSRPIERVELWHTPSDCRDHHKCWLSGRPASRAAVRQAFARVLYADGLALTSPLVRFDSKPARPTRTTAPRAWRSPDGLSPHPTLTSTQFWRTDVEVSRLSPRASRDDLDVLWAVDREPFSEGPWSLTFFGLTDPRWNRGRFESLAFHFDTLAEGRFTAEATLGLLDGSAFTASCAVERDGRVPSRVRAEVALPMFAKLPAGTTWRDAAMLVLRGVTAGPRLLIRRIERADKIGNRLPPRRPRG